MKPHQQTQNAKPLKSAPDPVPVMKKARAMASLANRIDASVAPMSLVGLRCQSQRPDLTLRFINDAHLNKTMAYLTACSLYAALFDRTPEGLPIDSIRRPPRLGRRFLTQGKCRLPMSRSPTPVRRPPSLRIFRGG